MNDISPPTLTAPKQMKTIITLMNLVKGELFITIDHAERCLEMFISERQSNASLQQFTQALQQIRGTLALIEIKGALLLTDLMLEKTLSISSLPEKSLDAALSLLSTSIFKLRRYLENLESFPDLLSELLIPAINELRVASKLPPLPISYFTDIKLCYPSLAVPVPKLLDNEAFARLRQMYQIGLLGLIKEENNDASLRMMSRAIDRLQKVMNQEQGVRLCIIAAAALESFTDSNMTPYPVRKKLFRQLDQQLRDIQIDQKPCNETLLKDLLYLVLLDNVLGIKALTVFGDYNLSPLPYNNSILEIEIAKLIGPGQDAICSFTAAITEELTKTQNTIDEFTNTKQSHKHLIEPLLTNLRKLLKTLSLVNLHNAEVMLKEQIGILEINKDKDSLSPSILDGLADVILQVESSVLQYETNAACDNNAKNSPNDTVQTTTNLYLKQGRELAIKETLSSIGTVQLNITAYVESKGDKQFLENMPQILDEIYGCLLFLGQIRAAKIIRQCSLYISQDMLTQETLQDTKQLDNLADILASLEFFIETGMQQTNSTGNEVLDLAEESLITLNAPNFEPPIIPETQKSELTAEQPEKQIQELPSQQETSFSLEEKTPLFLEEETFSQPLEELKPLDETPSLEAKVPLYLEEDTQPQEEVKIAASGNHSLNFSIDGALSSEALPTPEELLAAKKEEEKKQLDSLKAKSSFSLEPITETDYVDKKEEEPKADDDDISFTRPDKWTLS